MNMSLLESLYPNQQFWCSIPKQPVWGVLFKTQTSQKKSRSEPIFRFDQVPSTAHDVWVARYTDPIHPRIIQCGCVSAWATSLYPVVYFRWGVLDCEMPTFCDTGFGWTGFSSLIQDWWVLGSCWESGLLSDLLLNEWSFVRNSLHHSLPCSIKTGLV